MPRTSQTEMIASRLRHSLSHQILTAFYVRNCYLTTELMDSASHGGRTCLWIRRCVDDQQHRRGHMFLRQPHIDDRLDLLQVLPFEILHYAYDGSNGRRRIVIETECLAHGVFIA